MFKGRLETVKLAKLYIPLSAYPGAVLSTGTVSNLALLKYVELERQNSSIKQAHDSSLTKTIAMIFTIVVETFLTIIIFLNIATYSFIKSKDTKKRFRKKLMANILRDRNSQFFNHYFLVAILDKMYELKYLEYCLLFIPLFLHSIYG